MVLEVLLQLPRDLRQVQNIQYLTASNPDRNKCNNADDLQTLLSIMHNMNLSRRWSRRRVNHHLLFFTPKVNSQIFPYIFRRITLFLDVLGVDRTFNLGACFVALFIYVQKSYAVQPRNQPFWWAPRTYTGMVRSGHITDFFSIFRVGFRMGSGALKFQVLLSVRMR